MFNFHKKVDSKLRDDVAYELTWDPSVSSENIKVTVDDGIVTLNGDVPHYREKSQAVSAAQRVGGVRAVADELDVKLPNAFARNDSDIAKAALSALEWSYSAPMGVKVSVDRGWITLKGNAEWDYERQAARNAVSDLEGVCGVTNDIKISSIVRAIDIKSKIQKALERLAEAESQNISVTVIGNNVNLSGTVHSLSEIADVRLAAWSAPGVMNVEDHLVITA